MTKTLSERIALFAGKIKKIGKQLFLTLITLKPDVDQALLNEWAVRHVIDQSIRLISEEIRIAINHEIRELTRISRQAAIMNLLAAVLVLISTVIVSFTLL